MGLPLLVRLQDIRKIMRTEKKLSFGFAGLKPKTHTFDYLYEFWVSNPHLKLKYSF
jgi:hypothetical protein